MELIVGWIHVNFWAEKNWERIHFSENILVVWNKKKYKKFYLCAISPIVAPASRICEQGLGIM